MIWWTDIYSLTGDRSTPNGIIYLSRREYAEARAALVEGIEEWLAC